jgi:uncharacterized protein (TIGR00251 family)
MVEGVVIAVRVTPRAGRDEVLGVDDAGVLRVRVAAAPVEGAANKALVRTLAAALDLPSSAVTVVAGANGRHKRVRLQGLDAAGLAARWPGLARRGTGQE